MIHRGAFVPLALIACSCGFSPAALADDTTMTELDPALFAAPPDEPLTADAPAGVAPASELAAGLDVKVDQKRRRFRANAVEWMAERSAAMGRMTDLLLGGADSGVHLVVDPRGADEYMLVWKVRFR